MNGIEIFTKLYNEEIAEDECLEYNGNYLLRDTSGKFNNNELIKCLLSKDNVFKIENQQEVESKIAEKQKQERISQLEAELARLRGE